MSLRTALDALPNLTSDARDRIRAAVEDTIHLLATGAGVAWQPLNAIRHPTYARWVATLRSSLRAFRDVKVEAQVRLFDAVATEYSRIDRDSEAISERLMQVVLPFVERVLPVKNNDDDFVRAAILTRVMFWDNQRGGLSPIPGGRSAFSREEAAQLIERLSRQKGWNMEEVAQQAGVGVNQVYRIKQGKRVTTDTISNVAEALGCHPGDLFPAVSSLKRRR
jgi:DNA-binding Xre family transcriptional regulator